MQDTFYDNKEEQQGNKEDIEENVESKLGEDVCGSRMQKDEKG